MPRIIGEIFGVYINAHAQIVVGHVCKMAAEEGSAHSSSWNPVESGTSSTCPSDPEGTVRSPFCSAFVRLNPLT